MLSGALRASWAQLLTSGSEAGAPCSPSHTTLAGLREKLGDDRSVEKPLMLGF
jgi:hypothetical protein